MVNGFSITLKYHLTVTGCNYELTNPDDVTKKLAIELEQDAKFTQQEIDSCCGAPSRPLWVLQRMGAVIRAAGSEEHPVKQTMLDSKVQELTDVLGGCERILRTPIPTSYTRHTSRFLFIWAHAIPWVLYPATGVATLPCALFVSWALLGVEDIGVRLEEPFSELPLWQYTKAIQDSTIQQLQDHQQRLK